MIWIQILSTRGKFCGISVKGKGKDDPHTDTWDTDTVKVLGLLNSDWNSETMGGGFMHDNKLHSLETKVLPYLIVGKIHL